MYMGQISLSVREESPWTVSAFQWFKHSNLFLSNNPYSLMLLSCGRHFFLVFFLSPRVLGLSDLHFCQ